MKPKMFKEHNTVFAKDQPQYLQLPAYKSRDGQVLVGWELSLWERVKLLFTGTVWLRVLTFNGPLQPLLPSVENPYDDICDPVQVV